MTSMCHLIVARTADCWTPLDPPSTKTFFYNQMAHAKFTPQCAIWLWPRAWGCSLCCHCCFRWFLHEKWTMRKRFFMFLQCQKKAKSQKSQIPFPKSAQRIWMLVTGHSLVKLILKNVQKKHFLSKSWVRGVDSHGPPLNLGNNQMAHSGPLQRKTCKKHIFTKIHF